MVNENLVIRMGGLGDLTILTSSLAALKEREPRPLVLATRPENIPLLEGAPFLDRLISYEKWEQEPWFRVWDLRFAVEPPNIGPGKNTWENYTTRDRSDLFDDLLWVKASTKRFSLPIDKEAAWSVGKHLKELQRPIIGFAPFSRSPMRSVPIDYVKPVLDQLAELGSTVVFGKTSAWSVRKPWKASLNLMDRISVKEMVALVSMLDLIISPDTAPYHAAAALGKKCLALFGNIHPNTRTTYYHTVTPLYPQGEMDCVPCWDVMERTKRCRPDDPTRGANCMRLLTPGRIVEAARGLL